MLKVQVKKLELESDIRGDNHGIKYLTFLILAKKILLTIFVSKDQLKS